MCLKYHTRPEAQTRNSIVYCDLKEDSNETELLLESEQRYI